MTRWLLIVGALIGGAILIGALGSNTPMSKIGIVVLIVYTIISVLMTIFQKRKWKHSR